MPKPKTTTQSILAIILALSGAGSFISTEITVEVPDGVTPPIHREGWAGPADESTADAPQFINLVAADPNWEPANGAQVGLWEYAQRINGGDHLPTFRQETGDCVSMGAANAINYLQAVQIALEGQNHKFRPAFQPYIYGVSRTADDIGAGKLGRSAGSVGRWAAEAVSRYGVLAADARGVPAYSGRLADNWGYRGVPREFYDEASDYCVKTVAQVHNYEDARDAIASGYPVTVASNVGFNMEPKVYAGKHWGIRRGRWNHQMAFIGVDDKAKSPNGARGALYCLNSWGANAHGKPAGDEPPGGFWVDSVTANAMLSQGDSWAFSAFDGFPQRDLDFRIFGDQPVDLVDLPEPPPLRLPACELAGISRDSGRYASGLFGGGAALSLISLVRRAARRRFKLVA